jgi:uncharacterized protein
MAFNRWIVAGALALLLWLPAWAEDETGTPAPTMIVHVPMSDGVKIAAAVYLPKAPGRYPALFAASPYRFDNDGAPAVSVFLWRETGPIGWYLDHGYAYVHMDARGTGRSEGQYRYQDKREQRDLYEMIEWIAKQPWSSGKVGGIGQSYYARMQWFMGIENPPHLACIAPYDGNIDTYRASAYQGGIPSGYIPIWYEGTRNNNAHPLKGPPRLMTWDYVGAVRAHPTYDAWWKERAAAENLDKIKVPVFSIGVWSKVDLHLNGNIVGFQRAGGPKKLLVFGSSNVYAAVADYSGIPFHEKYLLEFYDWCLKGKDTNYVKEPPVRYFVTGAEAFESADQWPPPNLDYRIYYFGAGPTGSVTSLNDGTLGTSPPAADGGKTSYSYPNKDWRVGVVGLGPDHRPDFARRILTFTTPPLDEDVQVTGPIEAVLYISSTRDDADFIVSLDEQYPQSDAERQQGLNPKFRNVTKGWLRASHRAIDRARSLPHAPWYTDTSPRKIVPGRIYKLDVAIMPTAYLFKKGSRIRIDVAPSDSQITDFAFAHEITADMVGTDTIYHDAEHPSQVLLPLAALARKAASQK